ncbi:hypothetical protein D3C80_1343410 [compost metagenome]
MAGSNHQLLHRQHFVAQFDRTHHAMCMANTGHGLAQAEFATPRRPQARGQLLAKSVAITHFFIRGMDGANEGRLRQGRVEAGAVCVRQHLLLLGGSKVLARMVEAAGLAEGDQLAIAPPVETLQAIFFTPGLQGGLAQQRQAQQVACIGAVDRGAASSEESGHPAPLRRVEARAQFQWRVTAQHPAYGLQRHTGVGQRRHVAIGQLATVGEAGFTAQRVASLYQGHIEAVAHQRISRCQTNDAATDDACMLSHVSP